MRRIHLLRARGAGTSYYYKVAAENEGGLSPQAGPANATTKDLGLPAPTGLGSEPLDGAMVLAWQDNASGETAYVVERQDPGLANYALLALLPANATAYTDTYNLAPGQ